MLNWIIYLIYFVRITHTYLYAKKAHTDHCSVLLHHILRKHALALLYALKLHGHLHQRKFRDISLLFLLFVSDMF